MSLSQFFPGTLACLALLLSAPLSARAQSTYLPSGSEFSIPRSLPGEQSRAHLSLSPSGGFLVWQDNSVDGQGLGIRAVGLDSSLSPVQQPFRVNLVGNGDQERPQVALLKDGGAVFVWQGGRLGFQKIFARFLSPENNWVTPDLVVSTVTNRSLALPVVTTLENGNVVIAWASFNQRNSSSMHDVYAQIFSPAGNKIGGEIAVNQFSLYNQRTPAIAALPSGGFLLAWTSEQQRQAIADSDPDAVLTSTNNFPAISVDIVARVFDANGLAEAGEFIVNSDATICSNPQLAVNASGGYAIVWAERRFATLGNSIDISARAFSPSGLGGTVRRVNTHLPGDQFDPQVKAVRDDFMVVWTSLAQDGSYDGVYGRFLLADGSPATAEMRVNTTVIQRQFQPVVGADPDGRFLAVWSSYVGGPQTVDLYAKRYVATDYLPIAAVTNYFGPIADAWATNGEGGLVITPKLQFPENPPPSTTLPNGFDLAKGYYKGLFYEAEGVNAGSSGFFSMAASSRGTYSARLVLAGRSYFFSGRFDTTGKSTRTVLLPSGARLTVSLQLDLGGGNQVLGTVTSPSWSGELLADRQIYNLANPCPLAGRYNIIIPPAEDRSSSPAGSGFAVATITRSGTVTFNATLADGVKITQGSAVSQYGFWPLYAAPYAKRGLNLGWVQMSTNEVSGQFVWIKPRIPSAYYPGGFTNQVALTGAAYSRPATGARVLDWPSAFGEMVLQDGPLNVCLTNSVILNPSNRLLDENARPMNVKISLGSGWFYGSIPEPGTGRLLPLQGRLLQNSGCGYGFFRANSKVGQITIGPVPTP